MPKKKRVAKRPVPIVPAAAPDPDRITYRDLRNTPGRVWARLASNEPLTLMADGKAKALLIPVFGGDGRDALEAYRRGRAMVALARMRMRARETGVSQMTLQDVNAVIREARRKRGRGA